MTGEGVLIVAADRDDNGAGIRFNSRVQRCKAENACRGCTRVCRFTGNRLVLSPFLPPSLTLLPASILDLPHRRCL